MKYENVYRMQQKCNLANQLRNNNLIKILSYFVRQAAIKTKVTINSKYNVK